ncbi:MAG: restriction endonuclease, SacI family, partial [Chroococcidiopsidaceae cyanobacterium CP_BM_RX_35]|nr:restriction endonuclease, SacI family [Chroococcidiopsidaceae cyanobacterium CP_BM_RX_35]
DSSPASDSSRKPSANHASFSTSREKSDLFAGPERVETSRINDPDRHFPGDVGVRSDAEEYQWERVLEVRDKSVTIADVFLSDCCLILKPACC